MEIYIIFYIALLIYAFACPKNKTLLTFFCIAFCLLVGMRGIDVGADTVSYIQIYRANGQHGYNGYPEFLYGWSGWLMYQCGLNFSEYQTILMLLTISPVFYIFARRSPYPALSVFTLFAMYFLFYAMNGVRQTMACFILLPAYVLLIENNGIGKRLLPFSLLVIIASGFHTVALVAFIIPFILKLRIKDSFIFTTIFLSLIIGLLMTNDLLTPFIGGYSDYLEKSKGTRTETRTIMAVFLCIYWMILFCYTYLQAKWELKQSAYMKIYWFAILVNNILVKQEQGIRVVLFFSIIQTLVYPMLIRDRKEKRALVQLILMALLSIFLFTFLATNSAMVVPYETLDTWNKAFTTIS